MNTGYRNIQRPLVGNEWGVFKPSYPQSGYQPSEKAQLLIARKRAVEALTQIQIRIDSL